MTTPPRLTTHLPEHRSLAVGRFEPCRLGPMSHAVVHDHTSIALFLAGEVQVWMGATYTLQRGDIFIVPEGAPHYTTAVPVEASYGLGISACTACLDNAWGLHDAWGDRLKQILAEVRRGAVPVRRLDPEPLLQVERWFKHLEEELQQEERDRDIAISGLMSLIVVAIARASPIDHHPRHHAATPLVGKALRYIEEHASEAISLQEVALAVGRAPAHLAAVMKAQTGRTVVAWITHGRMALARQLLLTSDDNVNMVAERVGFASPSHFHRTFRRIHGTTPGAWRRAHRSNRRPASV
ncbi:MAG: AraC family transcriptional regulator [Myxococcota bacterium]